MAFQSNIEFEIAGTGLGSGASPLTCTVSNDLERGLAITATDVSVVLRNENGTKIERMTGSFAAGTFSIAKRGIDQSGTLNEVTALRQAWSAGTKGYITALAFDLFDKDGDTAISGNLSFTSAGKFGVPVYASEAARDLVITAPVNGQMCYCTAEGSSYQYKAGAWVSIDTGTPTPNATYLVAGKVQEATQGDFNDGVRTGSTGALLFATPDKMLYQIYNNGYLYTTIGGTDLIPFARLASGGSLAKLTWTSVKGQLVTDNILNLASAKTTLVDADTLALTDSVDSSMKKETWANVKAQLITDKPYSTTVPGFATMATDVIATAGANEATYINPKQAFDNYGPNVYTVIPSDTILASSDTEVSSISVYPSYEKVKEFLIKAAGTYRFSVEMKRSNTGDQISGAIFKDGVNVGIICGGATATYAAFTLDVAFAVGDLAQLYICTNYATTIAYAKNFSISGYMLLASAIPTVNL